MLKLLMQQQMPPLPLLLLLPLLLTLSGDFIRVNDAIPAVKPQSTRGIIYPANDNYNDCYLNDERSMKGVCKSFADCPSAVQRWQTEKIHPRTCYFNKFEQIVCCEMEKTPTIEPEPFRPPALVKRRSETECDSYHVFRTSIVHGVPAKPREFPYMVALGWKSNLGNIVFYRCGGVLVSNKFVLTAAHCAMQGGEFPSSVRLGGVNLTDESVSNVNISRIIVHPSYNVSSAYNDLALIELEQTAKETPVCLWSSNDVDHNNVTAIGYGHTRFAGSSSDQLQKTNLFLVTNENCQKFYKSDRQELYAGLSRTHICAGDPERLRDTCQGDSGGPLLIKVERDTLYTYVVGITSFGQGCAGEPPSIYSRISSYIDWIENIVWPVKM